MSQRGSISTAFYRCGSASGTIFEHVLAWYMVQPEASAHQYPIAAKLDQTQRQDCDAGHQRQNDERLNRARGYDSIEQLEGIEGGRQHQDIDAGGKLQCDDRRPPRLLQ